MTLGPRPTLTSLSEHNWDLIVIGGGITGAGVLLEAARLGYRALLLEQADFAWGTSSRSSKMVHGGLRYIAQGQVRLTRDALRERERLLRELPGLVERATYLFPLRKGRFPGRWPMTALLGVYDFLAGIRDRAFLSNEELLKRVPGLDDQGLGGALSYTDALTDDCRLVLRTLLEAARYQGRAMNYARVTGVSRGDGDAATAPLRVAVRDLTDDTTATLTAHAVINATGAWAGQLGGDAERIRPLRGSHLFFSAERLPVRDCLTVLHPRDRRPVFIFPWEGVVCVGTTDLDHPEDLNREPRASEQEMDYLLELLNQQFPRAGLGAGDVLSSMAGVRPVIRSSRAGKPSSEKRDHAVWEHDGVISVSGGKLTTFRLIALDALLAAGLLDRTGWRRARHSNVPLYAPIPEAPVQVDEFLHGDQDDDALLSWCLEHEAVVHLDDLLLRRTRLGLLRRDGGLSLHDRLQGLAADKLGWDAVRWQQEWQRYRRLRDEYYGVPGRLAEAS